MAILSSITAALTAGTTAATAGAAGTAAAATAGAASVPTAATAITGALGTAVSAAGTVAGMVGQKKQADAAEKAEKARERQLMLDAQRQRRQIVRESIMARSTALANATQQGAEGGSGLQGGMAQVMADAGRNILYTNQSETLGRTIFQANREAARGGTIAAFGGGLQSLGGMLTRNQDRFGRLGTYYMNRPYGGGIYGT